MAAALFPPIPFELSFDPNFKIEPIPAPIPAPAVIPLLCILHPNGWHWQCTGEDLRTWAATYGDPTMGGIR